jgi:hypothetical protein
MDMLKALWRGWLTVAKKIGRVQSQLILTLIYFVILAPFALAVRLFLDPMDLRGTRSWRWPQGGAHSTPSLDSVRQQF